MKHVLMILLLIGGFAMSESFAQANCKPANCQPCPPGCCFTNCCVSNGSAASVTDGAADVVFASLLTEGVRNDNKACNMSRKEKKACIAACKSQSAGAASQNCKPTTSCSSSSVALSKGEKARVEKL